MPNNLRFGPYEVDLAAGQLLRNGARVRLQEKSFQVLVSLLEYPGRVVTREELRQRLWPDDVFVDFDSNLNTAMARLRRALGDSPDHPRLIETLPKRGYRLLVEVFQAPGTPQAEPASRIRIVVLPFLNLSGDPAQECFSDAVTDGIITELAALAPDQLGVIARTTAMRYKAGHKDVARIGRELGVEYVVEGGIQPVGDRIGINMQLIRAVDQIHIWAQRYGAELRDIFELQAEIARTLAAQVRVSPATAGPGAEARSAERPARRPTENLAAYNDYIQGRQYLATLSPATLATAKQHFEQAIARDPHFALAYDSLAETYWWLGYLGFVRPAEAFSAGVLHAVRALELDHTLAETHALLAQYHKQLRYDWQEVAREMAYARALNPHSALVKARYALNALMPHYRMEEAVAEVESALELDPLSTYYRAALAIILLLWRRYDRALAEARRLIDHDPRAYWSYLVIGGCYREQRMFAESIAAHRKAVELSGHSAAMLGWLGLALGLGGQRAEARAILKRLHVTAGERYVPPTSFAWIHIGLSEFDEAFKWLDRAVEGCDQYLMPIKSYAFLDPLRSDPRFLALLRKMHLESRPNLSRAS